MRHGEHTQRVRLGRVLGRFKDKRTDVTGGPTWPADSASPARRAVSGSPSSPKASMGRRSAFGVFSSELLSLRSPRNRRSHCVMKLAPRALLFGSSVGAGAGPWVLSGPSCRPPGAPAWPRPGRVQLRPVSSALKQLLLDCREEDKRLSSPCIGDYKRVMTQGPEDLVPGCCRLGAGRLMGPRPRICLGKQRAFPG